MKMPPLFWHHSAALLLTACSLQAAAPVLPAGLAKSDWAGIRAAYEAGRHAIQPVEQGFAARNPGQQWRTRFDRRGFLTQPDAGGWHWGLELKSYGFPGRERLISGEPEMQASGQRLTYSWDALVQEWFVNDQRGLEHGFTVQEIPDSRILNQESCLTFTLAVRGGLRPRVTADAQAVQFLDERGATVLNYSGLKVWDADGKTLPAHFAPAGNGLRLLVDERGARYPLTIDPIAQQAYLKAFNTGESDSFGFSMAMSGNTVVVGAVGEASGDSGVGADHNDDSTTRAGAAYVFVRNGTTWTQQAYLKASNTDESDSFGYSVSVSGDTIVVGAEWEDSNATGINGDEDNNSALDSGAAYVFVRHGTTWSQQAYLKASNTGAHHRFGCSVGVSGDTVVVGAWGESTGNINFQPGAAYVFTRLGSTWSQQAFLKASNLGSPATATGSDDQFGWSVAVSGDTIVVGAVAEDSGSTGVNSEGTNNDATDSGAAYVFVRSGVNWSEQAYLKASNTGFSDQFGYSVAVSGDTVVVGAPFEDSNAIGFTGYGSDPGFLFNSGAAYIFERSGTDWTEQAYLKASNTGGGDLFGGTVAVSGGTVVVGAPTEDSDATGINGDQTDNSAADAGAAYVFVRGDTTWSQQAYLKASNTWPADYFGGAVAVSGDTVIVSADGEDSGATGINGSQTNNSALGSGAAYTFIGLGPVPAPEIEVEYPALATFLSDGSTLNFGDLLSEVGKITLIVRNVGNAKLTGLAITKSGTSAADYKAVLGATSLNPGASTTLILTLNAAAKSKHHAEIQIASNDADESPFDITLRAPEIQLIDPASNTLVDGAAVIDFGDIPSNVITLTVFNEGSAFLKFLSVAKFGAGAVDYEIGPLLNTEAGPNSAVTFDVTFNPNSQGTHLATLEIRSNDFDEDPFHITLKAPELSLEQPAGTEIPSNGTVDYGTVTVGTPKTLTFTVRNKGSGILRFTTPTAYTIPLEGLFLPTAITGPKGTILLAANASTTFAVKLTPDVAGLRTAHIECLTNDADEDIQQHLNITGFAKPAITLHPTPQLVGAGDSASFLVAATGSGSLIYTWLKDGKAIPGAPSAPTYTIPAAALAQAGKYSCLVTNSAGSASSGSARLGVVGSAPTPVTVNEAATLVLTVLASIPTGAAPTHQWRKSTMDLGNSGVPPAQIVSGTTTAKLGITKAGLVNEGSYTCVVGMDGLTKESGPFIVTLLMKPVVAAGGPFPWLVSGPVNELITATSSPTKFVFTTLPAGVAGNPLTGQLSGKPTKATTTTKTFGVTASNAAGTSPAVFFDYTIADLPAPVVGTFNGLVDRSTLMSGPVAGQMLFGHGGSLSNLVITSTGVFTGTLRLEDKTYPMPAGSTLSATAGGDPTATVVILRGKAADSIPDLTLTFSINRDTGELTGTVTDGTTPVALKAWRNQWKTTEADAFAGSYTATLALDPALAGTDPLSVPPGAPANVAYPQGTGFLTLTLTTAGVATWGGKLADGSAVTGSTTLGPDGEVPLHLMLYTPTAPATAGSLLGWTQVSGTDLDSIAPFDWLKRPQLPTSTTRSYKGGFPLHSLTVIGGKYVKPAVGDIMLGLDTPPDNAQVLFSEGGIKDSTLGVSGALTQIFSISTTNTADMPKGLTNNPGTVTVKLNAATGAMSGTFILTDNDPRDTTAPFSTIKRSVTWVAVSVPRLASAVGHFQLPMLPTSTPPATTPSNSPMLSGSVLLEAAP